MIMLWFLLAQSGGNITLINPVTGTTGPSAAGFGGFWTPVLNSILALSVVAAVLMLLYAGFTWITAAGNKEKIGTARQTVVWVIFGLLVLLGAYAFLNTLITVLRSATGFKK